MNYVPLRELCSFRHGGTPSKANASFWQGSIPWVSPKDMKSTLIEEAADHISEDAVSGSATSIVPPGAILVVVRSGILVHSLPIAQVGRPVAFNQDIKAIIPHSDLVSVDFLFWFLRSQANDVVARGVKKGATVHSVQSGFIENLLVPVPPLDRQLQMVDILSRAEGIVRLRREAQQKAAELIPAIFIDMFGDPARNPKGWPVANLGEALLSVDYGCSVKASADGAGLPIIRMSNVTYAGNLDLDDLKYVELPPNEIEKYGLQEGDLLFNRTNSKELVGKTALWDGRLEAVVASYFMRLRVVPTQIDPTYLWAFLNSKHMKQVLFDTARGAIGQANINSKELKAFAVMLPPLDQQHGFKERVEFVNSILRQQSEALAKATATFDALLARAFDAAVSL
ncbi:MAG: restriction endonuclease subunit S [Pseudomonadales bacterium]|nr:restriction endonuclease subunit S [Gammaproteobacteria bacterium]MBP6479949.1 restriction endonuclease subunit S [Pseudomonadales bacterium]MBP7909120.1 restriction endonuclease subunit S [Pseudomonadales bacterium]